ncbi:unnamed protein product [Tilletia controversa]|nr:unnamed protein product [Tilletia controversa]
MHRSSHSSAPTFAKSFWWLFTSSWLNVLMVPIPLSVLAEHLHWGALIIFVFNFLALVPLAKLLGDCTEQVSIKLGPTLSALANVTFGDSFAPPSYEPPRQAPMHYPSEGEVHEQQAYPAS